MKEQAEKPYDPQQMIGLYYNPYDWDNAKRMKEMREIARNSLQDRSLR